MKDNILDNQDSKVKVQVEEWLVNNTAREGFSNISVETNISPEDFINEYQIKNRPVILKGAAKDINTQEKWSFDFFSKNHGDIEVNVNLYDKANIKKASLKDFISQVEMASEDYPLYLQEWWFQNDCPKLLEEVAIPQYFENDKNLKLLGFNNSTLWLGQKGAFTPIHQDTVYANIWTAQMQGSKEWVLFNKDAVMHRDADGNIDFQGFVDNKDNDVMYGIIEEGDILYVPFKWWHRAETLENAISMNTFYISDEIVQRYIKDVFSIPLAMSLNKDLLVKYDPMRYNITMSRIRILANMMGMDADNILGIETGQAETSDKIRLID